MDAAESHPNRNIKMCATVVTRGVLLSRYVANPACMWACGKPLPPPPFLPPLLCRLHDNPRQQ
jgi:hypothetical protein